MLKERSEVFWQLFPRHLNRVLDQVRKENREYLPKSLHHLRA